MTGEKRYICREVGSNPTAYSFRKFFICINERDRKENTMFEMIATVYLLTLMALAFLGVLAIPVMAWMNVKSMDKWN